LKVQTRLDPSLLQTFLPSLHVLRRQASPLGRAHPNSQPKSRKFTIFSRTLAFTHADTDYLQVREVPVIFLCPPKGLPLPRINPGAISAQLHRFTSCRFHPGRNQFATSYLFLGTNDHAGSVKEFSALAPPQTPFLLTSHGNSPCMTRQNPFPLLLPPPLMLRLTDSARFRWGSWYGIV